MTRVDFYIDADDRRQVACRLSAKAVERKRRVFIHTRDAAETALMDALLWQVPPSGFLPHGPVDAEDAARLPVLVDHRPPPAAVDDVLINLSDAVPAFFGRFERLIEIVSRDDADKAKARDRFRHYRDLGYTIETQTLGPPAGQ